MSDIDRLGKLGKEWCDQWDLNEEKISAMESEFMSKVRALLWYASSEEGDEMGMTEKMASCYKAQDVLKTISGLVDDYKDLYHMVRQTNYWIEFAEEKRERK